MPAGIGDPAAWIADFAPAERGRSRETARRSGLAGRAEYGHCASHSRFFRGPRLHQACRTPGGVIARVLQRILAPTAAIWHNDHTRQPVMRSLTAYDH
jgi:hypothetical protein